VFEDTISTSAVDEKFFGEVKPHFPSSPDHHFVLYSVVNLHPFGEVEECTQLFAH